MLLVTFHTLKSENEKLSLWSAALGNFSSKVNYERRCGPDFLELKWNHVFCRSIVVSFKLNLFSNTEEHVAVCFFLIPQNEIILLSIERSSNHPKRLDSLCGRLRKPPTILMHCLEKTDFGLRLDRRVAC